MELGQAPALTQGRAPTHLRSMQAPGLPRFPQRPDGVPDHLLPNVVGTTVLDPHQKQKTDILLDCQVDLWRFIDLTLRNNPGPDGKPTPTQTLSLLSAQGGNLVIDVIQMADGILTGTDPLTEQSFTTDHDQRGMPRPTEHEQVCDGGAYEPAE